MPGPTFQLSFDKKARAACLTFTNAQVAETIEASPGLLVDLDHAGNLVGIEILTAGTLGTFLQPAESRPSLPELPEIEPDQVREIERLFETMTA